MSEMKRRDLKQSHKSYRFLIDACQKGGKQQLALEYIDIMLEAFKEEGAVDDIEWDKIIEKQWEKFIEK